MIRPITFQSCQNFDANLYALEMRSRFTDLENANGYYPNYGDTLRLGIAGNSITIGKGAFMIQGRMLEITSTETIPIPSTLGNGIVVGTVIAKIETYKPDDNIYCSFRVTMTEPSSVSLVKEDTYSSTSNTSNKVYEVPFIRFTRNATSITSCTLLLEPIEEFKTMSLRVKTAVANAQSAAISALNAEQSVLDMRKEIQNYSDARGTVVKVGGSAVAQFDAQYMTTLVVLIYGQVSTTEFVDVHVHIPLVSNAPFEDTGQFAKEIAFDTIREKYCWQGDTYYEAHGTVIINSITYHVIGITISPGRTTSDASVAIHCAGETELWGSVGITKQVNIRYSKLMEPATAGYYKYFQAFIENPKVW